MKILKNPILIFTFLIIGYFNEGHTQPIKSYGIKVALTSANQTFHYTQLSDLDTKKRIGFNIGAYVEWLNHSIFSVLTELDYVQRGMGDEIILTGSSPEPIGTKILYSRLDYLSIPILAKLTVPFGSIQPFIFAGPRVDFLLGYKSDYNSHNLVYDNFEKHVFGGSLGLGIEIKDLLKNKMSIEMRYNFDFKNSYATQFLKVSNNAYDIWLGVEL